MCLAALASVLILGCATPTGPTQKDAQAAILRGVGSPNAVVHVVVPSGGMANDSLYVRFNGASRDGERLAQLLGRLTARIAIYGEVRATTERVARNALRRLSGGRREGSELVYVGTVEDQAALESLAAKAGVRLLFLRR